jgi:adenylate cyclase class 2
MKTQELEVKHLNDLPAFRARLDRSERSRTSRAARGQPALRYPQGDLSRKRRCCACDRIRSLILHSKALGGGWWGLRRRELEVTVDDFEAARLLEALGYKVMLMYEKYRADYRLDGVMITLDEMPYGNFTELEGLDAASIQAVAKETDLDWETRILGATLPCSMACESGRGSPSAT